MRTVIDIRGLSDFPNSGISCYAKNLIFSLAENNPNDTFYLFNNIFKKTNTFIQDSENLKNLNFNYPNKFLNSSLLFLKRPLIDILIKNKIGDYDAYLAVNLNFFSFSKANRIKKIITVHDLSFDIFPNFYSLKTNFWHKFINPRVALNDFDAIIADSQSTKNDLIDLYNISENKISVIHLGTNIGAANGSLLDVSGYKPYILSLNTLEPRKNLVSLIKAYLDSKKYHNHKLVIVGNKGWLTRPFKDILKRLNSKDIIVLEEVSQNDKFKLLQESEFLAYPSFYEGFGLPPLEAMQHGRPVICGLNSSIPETSGSHCLMIDPHNIKSISLAITALCQKEIHSHFQTKAYSITQKFTWLDTSKQTYNLIKSLC